MDADSTNSDGASALAVAQGSLKSGRRLVEVEPGIYSALADLGTPHHYDRFAGLYDRLIGSRLYNRIVWGSDLGDYSAFAEAAVRSSSSPPYLDAGCGSQLFTAAIYARSQRPIVAVDHSIEMLRRARTRLQEIAGRIPNNVVLVQADLLDLPFTDESFSTVLSMGMLHLFADAPQMLQGLRRCLQPRGRLYLNTLVVNGRWGDRYLALLQRNGEVAATRTIEDVRQLVSATTDHVAECRAVGNIAYAIAGVRA